MSIALLCAGIYFTLLMISLAKWLKKQRKLAKPRQLPEVEPKSDEEGFIGFCYGIMPRSQRIKKAEAEAVTLDSKIAALAEDLQKTQAELEREHTEEEQIRLRNLCKFLQKDIQMMQAELGKNRARLNNLREHKDDITPDFYTREQSIRDFIQIKSMRGVCQIFMDKSFRFGHEENILKIYVRVAYPYEKFLYDLGDYVICISQQSADYWTHNVRHDGRSGLYGDDFCFGDRAYEIGAYINNGRIVEAVEIMIECLHHVNKGDLESIPERYKTIRKLSRRERRE